MGLCRFHGSQKTPVVSLRAEAPFYGRTHPHRRGDVCAKKRQRRSLGRPEDHAPQDLAPVRNRRPRPGSHSRHVSGGLDTRCQRDDVGGSFPAQPGPYPIPQHENESENEPAREDTPPSFGQDGHNHCGPKGEHQGASESPLPTLGEFRPRPHKAKVLP
jgi:hypothetical protein